jgi:hypothetical protein
MKVICATPSCPPILSPPMPHADFALKKFLSQQIPPATVHHGFVWALTRR